MFPALTVVGNPKGGLKWADPEINAHLHFSGPLKAWPPSVYYQTYVYLKNRGLRLDPYDILIAYA